MDIKISINCDNTAFEDDARFEIAHILIDLKIHVINKGVVSKLIKDTNGNTVGKFEVI